MLNTDVPEIMKDGEGVLISVAKPSAYFSQRQKALEQLRDKERINNLEKKLSNIESLLQQLINQKAN